MGNRRKSREAALQLMFQYDLSGLCGRSEMDHFWRENPTDDDTQRFTEILLQGTLNDLATLDHTIGQFSANWKLHRMAAVDRNVLRLAVYELTQCPDIPMRVTLNEAIEIAKKFGSEDSGAFINGILDQVARSVKKSD